MTNIQKPTDVYTASDLEQIDEDELVNRFKNGDIEAFNPLVLKYQKKIYNLIYQQIRDRETAKDISQEVFLKAFKALPNFTRWLRVLQLDLSDRY